MRTIFTRMDCVYFERSGRGSQVAGGHSAGYAAAVRDRESLPAHGSRDRENAPESQCAGTRNYSGGAQNIKYITMKLDENERSTQIRLMKVKDMMLEEKHHYKEKRELCS